jgi:hypothetical protein
MKQITRVLSVLALAGTMALPILFFADRLALADLKFWMLVSTIVWFAATPIWMDRES